MGLDVCLSDAGGNVARRVIDSGGHLAGLAVDWSAAGNTCCLRQLDPYGDAVFQGAQLRRLCDELQQVHSAGMSAACCACLDEVRALVSAACGQAGAVVRFQGD